MTTPKAMTTTIPLLDLSEQYAEIREEVDAAIRRVVDSQRFILGAEVEALEREVAQYLGEDLEVVACASGTDALLLSLKALDLEPGDEVIVPAFTFFASAGAVWNAGLKPVFCDVDPAHFNVTEETVAAAWSGRTKAVMPVHLFGQKAPMAELAALAEPEGVAVIEDAAQSIGASQAEPTGHGIAAAFSFFPSKNLGAFGDGGAVSTSDAQIADRLRKLRVHGGEKMYHHEVVGTNSRLDALQAGILRAKLPHLDRWSEARRRHAALYDEGLADVPEVITPVVFPGNVHVYNQYTIRARRRSELRQYLTELGIGSGVYYPVPLHLQECFASLGGRPGRFPVSESLCEQVLSLPVYPELGAERVEVVIAAIRGFYA